jgi:hypothetical protein
MCLATRESSCHAREMCRVNGGRSAPVPTSALRRVHRCARSPRTSRPAHPRALCAPSATVSARPLLLGFRDPADDEAPAGQWRAYEARRPATPLPAPARAWLRCRRPSPVRIGPVARARAATAGAGALTALTALEALTRRARARRRQALAARACLFYRVVDAAQQASSAALAAPANASAASGARRAGGVLVTGVGPVRPSARRRQRHGHLWQLWRVRFGKEAGLG